jgi:hypothetical protein
MNLSAALMLGLTVGYVAIPAIALAAPQIVQPAKAKTVNIGDTAQTVKAKLGKPKTETAKKLIYLYQVESETIEFTMLGGKVSKIEVKCQGACG